MGNILNIPNSLDKASLTLNNTFTGANSFNNTVTFKDTVNVSLSGANQRLPSHSAPSITLTNAGLTSLASANNGGVATGHTLIIVNKTGNNLTIVNNYGLAAAGEKIYTGTNTDTLIPNNSVFWLVWNSSINAWACTNSGLFKTINGNTILGNGNTNLANYSNTLNNLQISFTGSLTETVITPTLLIEPNSIMQNDIFKISAMMTGNSVNNKTFRVYLNSVNSLAGAILIGTQTFGVTSGFFKRSLNFQNSLTNVKVWVTQSSSYGNEEVSSYNNQGTTFAVPNFGNNVYMLITAQLTNIADTVYLNNLYTETIRK